MSDQRIALITGASRGIGAAVAKALAAEDIHVLLMARTIGALEEVNDAIHDAGGKATIIPQDMNDLAALETLGPTVMEQFGRLDILVGNAATLGILAPLPHVKVSDWQNFFTLNVHANFVLLRTLDPLLKASEHGRAVFTTSGVSHNGRGYWGPYAATKAALEGMVLSYAEEIANTNIKVNLVDPGAVRTKMRAEAVPGEDPQTLPPPEDIAPTYIDLCSTKNTKNGEIVRA